MAYHQRPSRRPCNPIDPPRRTSRQSVRAPSKARADRQVKRRPYRRVGVPEYWMVDVDTRLIERWRPTVERPELVTDPLEWRPGTDPAVPALEMDLATYVRDAPGK